MSKRKRDTGETKQTVNDGEITKKPATYEEVIKQKWKDNMKRPAEKNGQQPNKKHMIRPIAWERERKKRLEAALNRRKKAEQEKKKIQALEELMRTLGITHMYPQYHLRF